MDANKRLAKRVLLIGWDAADWKLIDKYMAEGAMPFMTQFLERGARGNLATLQPVLSPMLWNSIATGKRAYKHGIHGFTEPMPDGKGVRPSSSTTRKCKALWNILTQQGMTSNVVSWFVGHPAEPINGICVSEMFRQAPIDRNNPQSTELPEPAPQSIHPESMRDELAGLRMHPAELTEAEILPFIPKAAKIDQDKDRRMSTFAKLFVDMINTHNAATHLIGKNDWDFMGVYYDAIDHFGHAFMEYHPPRMAHVSEQDFEIYQHLIAGCYKFHDLILGRLMNLAGEDTTIILCSDHGYHSDHLRPKQTPKEPAGPAIWHRNQGIIAMAGPGVKPGASIVGANLLDIAPTVLNLLGLPAGRDMDGKTLTHAIGVPGWTPPESIDSWEDVPGEAGMHPKDQQEDPFAAREAMRQLVELGYIEEPDKDDEVAAQRAAREAKFNVARSYMDGGEYDEAAKRLEELFEAEPDQTRFGIALMRIYMRQRRFGEARPLAERMLGEIERLRAEKAERIDEAIKRIDEKPDEIIDNAREGWENARAQFIENETKRAEEEGREPRQPRRDASPIDADYLAKRRRLLSQVSEQLKTQDVRSGPTVNLLLGQIESIEGNHAKALEHLAKAEQAEPRLPGLHLQLGQTYLRLRRNEDARRAFEKALEIDADNALAHEGLATALTRLQQHERAVDHALSAVELVHEMPRAHLRLGITLARLGLYDKATQAFHTCLKLAPMTAAAHRYLAALYRKHLGRPDLAQQHRQLLREVQMQRQANREHALAQTGPNGSPATRRHQTTAPTPIGFPTASDPDKVITIVSGLPRTGTSMMMQMLVAGGMTPLTDGNREADASNPRGYYEYDKATQLATDTAWVSQAQGKVVKIVAQLLPKLPDIIDGKPAQYRVVFMDRDLDEVLASQRTMLDRQDRKGADLNAEELAGVYRSQLEQVYKTLGQRKIPWLMVRHADAINDAESVANTINEAFGGTLNVKAMVEAVDPSLYRERSSTPSS